MFTLLDISEVEDYSKKKVLIPLSGGINSAAVLCFLGEYQPENLKPSELHLFYSHLREHSPETMPFVIDLMKWAKTKFSNLQLKITRASVNRFFEQQHMIPHPSISPCSIELKIKPRQAYMSKHGIDLELIGFVKEDFRRFKRAQKYDTKRDRYPILEWSDDDCFKIVKDCIGWYPPIYDIKEKGRRVFGHNNCLPCKNMTTKQLGNVAKHYPDRAAQAVETASRIPGAYWGRDDVPDVLICDSCTRFA
jgi:3'-phosphoadenosine 5'-phosphosulfate sulfotransferase (PAPS reductase)/FAD synthetase